MRCDEGMLFDDSDTYNPKILNPETLNPKMPKPATILQLVFLQAPAASLLSRMARRRLKDQRFGGARSSQNVER